MILTEEQILEKLRGEVIFLTGAGISKASGIPTFRGQGGLYNGVEVEELATPEGFRKDPVLVWNWYLMRLRLLARAAPNPAHHALVALERLGRRLTLATSNVDDLHERAGSSRVHKLHGRIRERRCTECRRVTAWDLANLPEDFTAETLPRCPCGGLLRPNVVWFGERPWEAPFTAIRHAAKTVDLLVEVGVSGYVTYGIAYALLREGIPVVSVNPDPESIPIGATGITEPAEVVLPRWVAALEAAGPASAR